MCANIRISVVIPTYNRGHCVGRAIDSALNQRYVPAEIIVVDDGSTDTTPSLIKSYGQRVRYLQQPNGGVSAARNRGVGEAKFEWIAFLDSDDYWVPDHLQRMASAIEATQGEAALYFADVERPPEESVRRQWDRCGLKVNGAYELNRNAGEWALLCVHPMMLQASVIRRQVYLDIGSLPERMRTREDTLLFFKVALQYPVCAVSGCGTIMTSDGNMRLTQVHDAESLIYHETTILLYDDVLRSVRKCSAEHRRRLVNFLAASYFSVGRVSFREKLYLKTVANVLLSFATQPSVCVNEFMVSVKRNIARLQLGGKKGGVERTNAGP